MNYFPLTQAQKRILYTELLYPNTAVSTIGLSLIVQGNVDCERLQESIIRVLEENDTFHIKVSMEDGEPRQWFDKESTVIQEIACLHFDHQEEAEESMQAFMEKPIKYTDSRLYQVTIYNINHEEYWINMKYNHMICDGVSAHRILDLIMEHYMDLTKEPFVSKERKSSYLDYIRSEQEYEQSKRYQKDQEFWLDRFKDLPEFMNIKPYPPYSIGTKAKRITLEVSGEEYHQLNAFTQQHNISLYTLFLTSLYIYIHKISGSQDISVGSLFANRTSKQEKDCLGMFVSTVATRLQMNPHQDLLTLLHTVSKEQKSILRHQKYPYNNLIDHLREKFPKNDVRHLFSLSLNYQPVKWKTYDDLHVQHKTFISGDEIDDIAFNIEDLIDEQHALLHLEYRVELFEEAEMNRMLQQIQTIIAEMIHNPVQSVQELSILDQAELTTIMNEFSSRKVEYAPNKLIHQLFEEQAAKSPDAIAVVYENQELTYSELNARANQLARTLRFKGVQADQLVGIMTHRSLEMIVGVLAILKAGGAYVPIDPEYPEERIRYILQDSNAEVLLLQGELADRIDFGGSQVFLDVAESFDPSKENLEPISEAHHLAYVIYTSGTTGKPKGVMIEHQHVLSMASAWREDYHLHEEGITWLQWASFSFDVFTGDYIRALLHGGKLVICPNHVRLDFVQLAELIQKHHIQMFESTPAFVIPLMDYVFENQLDMSSLRTLILGSDQCSVEAFNQLIERFGSQMRILNSYGVTEACIDSCYFETAEVVSFQNLPIGKALPNVRMYILQEGRFVQPIGVAGELFIGGSSVGRGYLNRPDLNAEKFVENPFISGERMYRTGDLARWLPDGNIEFLGRADDQVKIRGNRIELGEVESQLIRLEQVKEGTVIAWEDEAGQKQLCAYYVADHELQINDLRIALAQELPNYMIPSYFVQLDKLPLTPNGKVDRKALPKPEIDAQGGVEYIAPRTEVEKVVTSIWQDVLGIPKIGILDHFFELGGDSIKAIQISSRMYQVGYKVEIRELFSYPVIAELSKYIEMIAQPNPKNVEGTVKLTAIQNWFFKQLWVNPNHCIESKRVYRKEGFREALLNQVFTKITEQHDSLRMIFTQTANGVEGWVRSVNEGESFSLAVCDFRDKEDIEEAIELKENEIKMSFDLQTGPLLKVGVFHGKSGDYLSIMVHGVLMDGRSWDILLEDIDLAYEQALSGQEIQLPTKTEAFVAGENDLLPSSQNNEMLLESVSISKLEEVNVRWSAEELKYLQDSIHQAYNTKLQDILLTSLGLALQEWNGLTQFVANVERSLRESLIENVDFSRTIGWLSSEFPVTLNIDKYGDLRNQIKVVKEALRKMPNSDLGSGVFDHKAESTLSKEGESIPAIRFHVEEHLQLDQLTQFIPVSFRSDYNYQDLHQDDILDIRVSVSSKGHVDVNVRYRSNEFQRESLEQLLSYFKASLLEVGSHCLEKAGTELTPSDVLLKRITIEELDKLAMETRNLGDIENIYNLTPMQQGMWFHTQMNPSSGVYFDQMTFSLEGDLDVDIFKKSFEALVQRHGVLRTNFYSGWQDEPLQIVFRNKSIDFHYEDLTTMECDEQGEFIESALNKDKMKGFDLERDSLIRLTIFKREEESYLFLLSAHHILMDGWCLSILMTELFELYQSDYTQKPANLATSPAYSEYIQWLEEQNKVEASEYWSEYLAGYEQQVVLPQKKFSGTAPGYDLQKLTWNLGEPLTQRINTLAKQQQVTINTLLQTAWGVLLQKYNGVSDVVFGGVVSGRPAEISGVEHMIGLFINTIPIRVCGDSEHSFVSLMKHIQDQALESQKYDYYPLYEIQEKTEQKQNLINHIMVFENFPVNDQGGKSNSFVAEGFEISSINVDEQTSFDLNLVIIPGDGMQIQFEYNALVYESVMLERLLGHFTHLLEQVVSNPKVTLKEVEIITLPEKSFILESFHQDSIDLVDGNTVHQLFEKQVERTPDALAVVFEEERITYLELNKRANQLARTLRESGIQPDQLVGVMVERSVDMIVALLSVLKAGGAYVPIDPEYPEDRIHYMLEDSAAPVLLTQRHLQERISFEGKWILVDEEESYHPDDTNLVANTDSSHLCYVIYTSGTTGKPKGVLIEHKQITTIASAWKQEYNLQQPGVRWLQWANFSFDVFSGDMVRALLHGGELVLCPSEARANPVAIHELIIKEQIQMFESTLLW